MYSEGELGGELKDDIEAYLWLCCCHRGVITFIFMVEGARAVSSLVMRSAMPGNMVVPREERENGWEGGWVKKMTGWIGLRGLLQWKGMCIERVSFVQRHKKGCAETYHRT